MAVAFVSRRARRPLWRRAGSVAVALGPLAVGACGASNGTGLTPVNAPPVSVWVVGGTTHGADVANAAVEFTASQLQTGGTRPPAVRLDFPATAGRTIDATAAAADAAGNLWIANDNSNTVVAYAPSQLVATSSPTPAITLAGASIGAPDALAFDAQGNLWVGNISVGTIVELPAAQLTASGAPTPAVTIVDTVQGNSAGPAGLAFDAAGDLWVANNVASTIVKYPASELTTSAATPSVVINEPASSFPEEIAFDQLGNLWVANTAVASLKGSIVEYAAATLGASGSPAPKRTLIPPGRLGVVPTGLAFNRDGNLWYTELLSGTLGEYLASQLVASGNPPPATRIVIADSLAPLGLTFYPKGAGLLP